MKSNSHNNEGADAAAKESAKRLSTQSPQKPGAVAVPAAEAARLDQRIQDKMMNHPSNNNNNNNSSGPLDQLDQLEQDVAAKQRAKTAVVTTMNPTKPGAYAAGPATAAAADNLGSLENSVMAKQRAYPTGGVGGSSGHNNNDERTASLEDRIAAKTQREDNMTTTRTSHQQQPGAHAELNRLEDAVTSKTRRSTTDGPGTARAELNALEDAVSSKSRRGEDSSAGATTAPPPPLPGARAELFALEDAVSSKVRGHAPTTTTTAAVGARAELNHLEDAVAGKMRAVPGARNERTRLDDAVSAKARGGGGAGDGGLDSNGVARQELIAMEADILSKQQGVASRNVASLDDRATSKRAAVSLLAARDGDDDDDALPKKDVLSMPPDENFLSDDKLRGRVEQAPPIRFNKHGHEMDSTTQPVTTSDQGVVQEPDLEYGMYGAAGNGLAVAMPVEEEEDDAFIPAAVEFDPDAKPPLFRNRRFRLYAFLAFFVLIAAAVGAGVGIALTKEDNVVDAPTMAPTTFREGLGIREKAERVAGKDELDNPDSAYSRALEWITYEDPLMLTPDLPNFLQRYIMAYIYYSTSEDAPWKTCNPPKGNETENCVFSKLVGIFPEFYQDVPWVRWLSEKHECDWAGVFCDDEKQIRALELSGSEMSGSFPAGITNLPFVQSLAFAWGSLRGQLPPGIVNMKHLVNIELHYNSFTGQIPKEWWQARSLVRINVGDNNLDGTIPTEISSLRDVKGLFVFENMMEGELPDELFDLDSLTFLRAHRNLFEGTLPTLFGKLTSLEEIWFHRNMFRGTIPSEIGLLSSMNDLRLHYNPLTGDLPMEMYNLTEMSRLDLFECNFTGILSPRIANMDKLAELRLRDNQLYGQIPSELGLLSNLNVVWLYGNDFTGSMPQEVCDRRGESKDFELEADCLGGDTNATAAQVTCATTCCTSCCSDATGVCLPSPSE